METKTKNDVVESAVEPTQQIVSTSAMLQVIERAAANPEIDVEKMERLLAMQERIFTKNAEMQFNDSMKTVQAEVPRILRDAKGENSKYTRLETIIEAIAPVYTRHGFALSFGTDASPLEKHYRITCDVSHVGGHMKHYFADVPADLVGMKGTPNKTPTHAFGSTMSYGRRYLTLLIFNLALVNEDDDGVAGGEGPFLSEAHVLIIYNIIKDSGLYGSEELIQRQMSNLARKAGKQSLIDLPLSRFDTIKAALENGIEEAKKARAEKKEAAS